jgi:hypothetical protein
VNILDVLERVRTIQAGLEITSPIATKIKRAYLTSPPSSKLVGDTPCFVNEWTMREVSFKSGLVLGDLEVHMQLLVYDADTDRAAAIATAFYPQIVTAFATNMKLGEGVPYWVKRLRSEDRTLSAMEIGSKGFVGLDLFLDVGISRGQVMEP